MGDMKDYVIHETPASLLVQAVTMLKMDNPPVARGVVCDSLINKIEDALKDPAYGGGSAYWGPPRGHSHD